MLLILGRRFRFLRWDRSGTIVTPATDYCENPALLCEMLWRMSLLNDEQLGLDPSARRILPKMQEYKDMDAASIPQSSDIDHAPRETAGEVIPEDPVYRYVREGFANSLGPEWPRYCLEVPHEGKVRTFLVGKPSFRASGMAGRGTRGYIALDCETKRFVWLKDAWRAHYDFVHKEGDVLTDLHAAGVPYIPTLVCHGDILDQDTKTPQYWVDVNSRNKEDSPTLKRAYSEVDDNDPTFSPGRPKECPLRRHKHYRIVVREVCMPLEKFQSGEQLLEIIFTCVFGTSIILTMIPYRSLYMHSTSSCSGNREDCSSRR